MQISSIKNLSKTPFGIAPTKKGLIEMDKLCAEGEKLLCGENSTSTTFDIPQYSMYSNEDSDTGIGKFASEESLYCIKTMKPYIGFDSEKIYPIGRFTSNGYAQLKFFCPYERGSFTIGEDNIEWNLLTKEEYGNILEKKDIKEFVEQNKNTRTRKEDINYENELGLDENYPIYKLLKKSYANFQDLPSLHPLKREFAKYKEKPITKLYDRLALYPYIKDSEPDLFLNFDSSKEKQAKFENYKKQYADEIEFFKFNQFIGYKQITEAKEKYNKAGVEITGDVTIGYSQEEYWAFKDAFEEDKSIGYEFPLFKYGDIKDKNSFAYNILKTKFAFACELYDRLRLDVGTSYEKSNYFKKKNGKFDYDTTFTYDNGDRILKLIDDTFKEVKGENADLSKITYEADGSPYTIDWSKGKPVLNKNFENRNLIYTTQYERLKDDESYGWGSVEFFLETIGIKGKYLTLSTDNHDGCPVKKIAQETADEEYIECRQNSIPVLEKALGLKKSFLLNPKNWVKAKFAELFLTPKRFLHLPDIFGSTREVSNHRNHVKNTKYRYRITSDFEEQYNTALQNNDGFNRPEAISMALRAKGLDKVNPVLYKKLQYIGKYLRKQGALSSNESDNIAKEKGQDEFLEKLNSIA